MLRIRMETFPHPFTHKHISQNISIQQERNQWRTRWSNSEKEILTLATHNGNYCEVLLPVAASQGDGQHVAAIIQTGSQRYKKKIKTQERHDLYRQIQNKVSRAEFD